MVQYQFSEGQRVYVKTKGQEGEVTICVPGNGSIPWYYVKTDDGQEDRYTADELEAI